MNAQKLPKNIPILSQKQFLGDFWGVFGEFLGKTERKELMIMQKKNYKGRWEKVSLSKSKTVCRFYSKIQAAYADVLESSNEIVEFRCNVPLDGDYSDYTTDFVCNKTDGTLRVRECLDRRYLTKPATAKLLEASRQYWYVKRGVQDWGIVVDKKKDEEKTDET